MTLQRYHIENIAERSAEKDRNAGHDHLDIHDVMQWLYLLETTIGNQLSKKTSNGWQYIPFAHNMFLTEVSKIVAKHKVESFLEIGCGLGTKLFLMHAKYKEIRISGFDHNKKYLKFARSLLPKNCKLFHQEALEYQKYGNFDLLYTYAPLSDFRENMRLIEIIQSQMKTTAHLIYVNSTGGVRIFKKQTNV